MDFYRCTCGLTHFQSLRRSIAFSNEVSALTLINPKSRLVAQLVVEISKCVKKWCPQLPCKVLAQPQR